MQISTNINTNINHQLQQQATQSNSHQQHSNHQQYSQYIRKKQLQQHPHSQSSHKLNQNLYIIIISIIFTILLISALIYSIKYRKNNTSNNKQIQNQSNNTQNQPLSPQNRIFTRHSHHSPLPISISTPGLCNSALPYDLLSQQNIKKSYYQWYGKVGTNINGNSYDVGHFIQRHLAVNGKCTYEQSSQGKSVFYDWNQVTKAFKLTSLEKCPLTDRTTFSYDFQIKIASPSNYIRGIDCRSGSIKNYSKILILYRRAIKNSNPYQDQYFKSNYATIWTFYPKN